MNFPSALRGILVLILIAAAGCSTRLNLTVIAKPSDAVISIDGQPRGRGPITERFIFRPRDRVVVITAAKPGYDTLEKRITREYTAQTLLMDLQPASRMISIRVGPAPAVISLDGQPLGLEPVTELSPVVTFAVDAEGRWIPRKLAAQRSGFGVAELIVNYTDASTAYDLVLSPISRNLSIQSTPPGATVTIDGQVAGKTPLNVSRSFRYDVAKGAFVPSRIALVKPGYEPAELTANWDDPRPDYALALPVKSKTVRVKVEPVGTVVSVNDVPLTADPADPTILTGKLNFPPTNDAGDLTVYKAIARRDPAADWETREFPIGWDDGQTDYSVALRPVITREVPLIEPAPKRTADAWEIAAVTRTTRAMKDVTEGPQRQAPVLLTGALPKDVVIDSIAVSPNGRQVLFTVLRTERNGDLRSQMITLRADGTGGAEMLSDFKSLDLFPSYTPDEKSIIFSSNRDSKRMAIWQISATGAPGVTRLTVGETNDLWPTLDSDPIAPRLFYEALVDIRPDSRIYRTQLGTTTRTDITQISGSQPRINAASDAVLFTVRNDKSGTRDIYRMSDKGGTAEKITDWADSDQFDPAWSNDGKSIAFTSDRGVDEEKQRNRDIWVIHLDRPERPVQITSNGSWDDRPVWDPSGKALYFRSNRGGSWGVWRIDVK